MISRINKTEILVATDLASRGLDFPFVTHVYNLDFPRTVSDYMHRAGRAGRAGRFGYVKSFYRNYDLPIIDEMRKSHEEQTPLKIGTSAFNLRKTHEKPVGSLKVSEPGKRESLGDPLKPQSDLVIRSYAEPKLQGPKPPTKPRVLQFKNRSKDALKPKSRSPVKEMREKKEIEKKFDRFQKKVAFKKFDPYKGQK